MEKMKTVVFVPTYQFQHLLDIINAKLETSLTIPDGKNEDRFKMTFGLGNTPRPRFLGRTHGLTSFRELCKSIPEPHPDDNLDKATQLGREEFERQLLRTRGGRNKTKKSEKNRMKRMKSHQEWGRSIKRVQRYLGLRGRILNGVVDKTKPTILDLDHPMINKPEHSVLFIAIDIEAWEQDQTMLTEVGIAMLDTGDIVGAAPGEGGQNWFKHIRARHIRVEENTWAMNRRYVHGCAERFDFGYVHPSLRPLTHTRTSPLTYIARANSILSRPSPPS
ncbi:hypothetical protein VTI74DRAFT_9788 [Chaetomium olivicolor]